MNIKQLYTSCLAQGAYYISHKGEAAIIDPLRETKPYLEMLSENGDTLKYIFETHFHADFVSGHVDLAKETGAEIVFGPNAATEYKSYIAKDNEEFKIGELTLRVLHTPGHTLESSTFLLLNEQQKPICIFTGDTLFIGDVGRPDLAIKSDLTQYDLAGMLFDSLRAKIMPLPDDIIVYPAHGAGSACGKSMSKDTFDTLGGQKENNYALQNISREKFIEALTEGILPPPQYFAKNAVLNKTGYDVYDEVLAKGTKALTVSEFESILQAKKALVLDVRKAEEFSHSHIPSSMFIGLDGQFAPWVGTLIIDLRTPILLVTPEGREAETVTRLARVGYDNCLGYLKGGVKAWKAEGKKIEQLTSIQPSQFEEEYRKGLITFDVRKPGEYESGHLKNAISKPLDFIYDWLDQTDQKNPYLVHCAGGYRSMIAASILKANGINFITDIKGGYAAISQLPGIKADIVIEPVKA